MLQKIIKVGNSLALTLPADFTKKSNLKAGDVMGVEFNVQTKWFVAKPKDLADQESLTPEFKNWLDNFLKEYKPILKKLSHL